MFNIGGGEMLVIGVVALIVVGPKDLPMLFRRVGQFTGRMRGMADEFRRSMDAAADEAGMNDIKKDFDDLSADARNLERDINAVRANRIKDIDESAKSLEAEIEADRKIATSVKKAAPVKKTTKPAATKTVTRKAAPKKAAPQKTASKKPAAPKTPKKEA